MALCHWWDREEYGERRSKILEIREREKKNPFCSLCGEVPLLPKAQGRGLVT